MLEQPTSNLTSVAYLASDRSTSKTERTRHKIMNQPYKREEDEPTSEGAHLLHHAPPEVNARETQGQPAWFGQDGYGLNIADPVCCGGGVGGEQEYLTRLRCPDGHGPAHFERLG